MLNRRQPVPAASQLIKYRLFVQKAPASIDLLKYLDKNIKTINSLGVRVHIEIIRSEDLDEKLQEKFQRMGIRNLPALIDPSGPKFIGVKKIVELFERNIKKAKAPSKAPMDPYGPNYGYETDGSCGYGAGGGGNYEDTISNFYMSELFQNGEPRQDKDEGEDVGLGTDYSRRMADYAANTPKHRQEQDARGRKSDAPRDRRETRERRDDYDHDDRYDDGRGRGARGTTRPTDNIADDNDYDDRPRNRDRMTTPQPLHGGAADDDIDQRMLDAWRSDIMS